MNQDLLIPRNDQARSMIVAMEQGINRIKEHHDISTPECPLEHAFAPGAYGRQIFIPKDTLLVGKIHKHAHLNFLMQGTVSVATEEGPVVYTAPRMMVSKAGTKRVVYTHEDTIWATVHLTHETDLEKIEEEIIAPSYEAFDAFTDHDVVQLLPLLQIEQQEVSL